MWALVFFSVQVHQHERNLQLNSDDRSGLVSRSGDDAIHHEIRRREKQKAQVGLLICFTEFSWIGILGKWFIVNLFLASTQAGTCKGATGHTKHYFNSFISRKYRYLYTLHSMRTFKVQIFPCNQFACLIVMEGMLTHAFPRITELNTISPPAVYNQLAKIFWSFTNLGKGAGIIVSILQESHALEEVPAKFWKGKFASMQYD